jgi:hypothetical protein
VLIWFAVAGGFGNRFVTFQPDRAVSGKNLGLWYYLVQESGLFLCIEIS